MAASLLVNKFQLRHKQLLIWINKSLNNKRN